MSLKKTKFCYNNHKKIKYFYKVQFNVTYLNFGRSLKAKSEFYFLWQQWIYLIASTFKKGLVKKLEF